MGKQHVAFRLDESLVVEVDAYASRLEAETGLPVSRVAAVTKLLRLALAAEAKRPPPYAP